VELACRLRNLDLGPRPVTSVSSETRVLVAVSGASGVEYARRLIEVLGDRADVIMSKDAQAVIEIETGLTMKEFAAGARAVYGDDNLAAAPASGSSLFRAVVVVPCSGTSLAKIAAGIADNLVTRAAAVAIKENRKLILVPRETPLSAIALALGRDPSTSMREDADMIWSRPSYRTTPPVRSRVICRIDRSPTGSRFVGSIVSAPRLDTCTMGTSFTPNSRRIRSTAADVMQIAGRPSFVRSRSQANPIAGLLATTRYRLPSSRCRRNSLQFEHGATRGSVPCGTVCSSPHDSHRIETSGVVRSASTVIGVRHFGHCVRPAAHVR